MCFVKCLGCMFNERGGASSHFVLGRGASQSQSPGIPENGSECKNGPALWVVL